MIRFENVSLRYGLPPDVLRDVSFEIEPGSFHFLTGPSGAGKSTLLRLMYLGLRPTRGRIVLLGQDITKIKRAELPSLRRRIGIVFQDCRLLDHLSVLDNVALPLRLAGGTEAEVRSHVSELLRWVGLGAHIGSHPRELSGGQQQQAAIARAVVARPSLLLADEPTGNVDDESAMKLMHLLTEINKLGTTIIVATHNRSLIRRMAKPCFRLEAGRLGLLDDAEKAAS
ncbi:MAG: cell division ATP-binding protein FtsE [Alphaproteobacteria bacterium]|nr:MAG: cell division ATP-binding protein FtsE [Alphaproteobacteria bacterium]